MTTKLRGKAAKDVYQQSQRVYEKVRQTNRQTDRQTDRRTNRQTYRQTENPKNGQDLLLVSD